MYISRMLLDVRNPDVRSDLAGLKGLYEKLSLCAGETSPLFRLDSVDLEKTGFLQPLVMVSSVKPCAGAEGVPENYFSSLETFGYNIPVRKGMNYSFVMRANPSMRIFFKDVEVDDPQSQKKWLESESWKNGFEIMDCTVKSEGYLECRERGMRLLSCMFEGSIKITREDRFRRALYEGVGRGKELGLGLLSVESFIIKEKRDMAEEMKGQEGAW